MKYTTFILFALFVMSACSGMFPVYEYGTDARGKNVYTVNVDSYSRQKAQNAALKTANEYCHEKGLKMNPTKDKNAPAWSFSYGTGHNVKLFFNCL